ncbi:MAG: YIEGIA family protein [Clostridia bacterium]|nr:YIEGIA family protein [Clostridia bacterium]
MSLEPEMLVNILFATLAGFLSRWSLLKVDFRQNPTYPNGYLIHLMIGLIASAVGAISVPALLAKDYVAITFLFLAFEHFRDVRKIEASSLEYLDKAHYYPRGAAYIDGIAKTFESRNYLAIVVSLTTITAILATGGVFSRTMSITTAAFAAIAAHILINRFIKGQVIKAVADIEIGEISFRNHNVYVNDIYVANIGLEVMKKRILERGIGVLIKPKGENEKIMLNNIGQRQAIEHECSRLLGLEKYIESRRDFETGNIGMVIIPIRKEPKSLIHIIENVPLLEIVKKQARSTGGNINEK